MKPRVIGIVGTAKNTGKTTTLIHLLGQSIKRKSRTGLAGIGYDGEEFDNVTRLPKPRILIEKGVFVATSEECLKASTCRFKVLERTGIITALGEVLIAEIEVPGMMILAGPNQSSGLRLVIKSFTKHGVENIFIDGSINRIIPLMEADILIFATGAARNRNPVELAREMAAIHRIFQLKTIPSDASLFQSIDTITLYHDTNEVQRLGMGSIFDCRDWGLLERCLGEKTRYIYIPGILAFAAFQKIISEFGRSLSGKAFIFPNPGHVLLGGSPSDFPPLLDLLETLETKIFVLEHVTLGAVTVNPFYPARRQQDKCFSPAYIDKKKLLRSIKKAVPIPVFNLLDKGNDARLYSLLTRGHQPVLG
jgi:hypothetical protein